jgi:hypothetical protein
MTLFLVNVHKSLICITVIFLKNKILYEKKMHLSTINMEMLDFSNT